MIALASQSCVGQTFGGSARFSNLSRAQRITPVRIAPFVSISKPARRGVVKTRAALDLDSVDPNKEKRLKYMRVVYDHEKWAAHRSTNRYFRHLLGIFSSRIIRGLLGPLVCIALLSAAIGAYETFRVAGKYIPPHWPCIAVKNAVAFNLSTVAMSLLLVFRTNTSYSRFDEARKLWGGCVNRSRDMARQSCYWFSKEHRSLLEAFNRWGQAFPWVLKNHLRERKQWESDLKDILKPEELQLVLTSKHGPSTVMSVMGEIANRAHLNPQQQRLIDENLTSFQDVVGACERILRTPIPVSYTRHTSRFLMLWLFCLPFTLWNVCGWATVPSAVVLSYVLLAIEEIGVQIEEPFVILPLEAISTTIAVNVRQYFDEFLKVKSHVKSQVKSHVSANDMAATAAATAPTTSTAMTTVTDIDTDIETTSKAPVATTPAENPAPSAYPPQMYPAPGYFYPPPYMPYPPPQQGPGAYPAYPPQYAPVNPYSQQNNGSSVPDYEAEYINGEYSQPNGAVPQQTGSFPQYNYASSRPKQAPRWERPPPNYRPLENRTGPMGGRPVQQPPQASMNVMNEYHNLGTVTGNP